MDLALQIQERVGHLDDDKKRLILEIIENFLPYEEASARDLHYIHLAEEEYANGEAISHNDIKWD